MTHTFIPEYEITQRVTAVRLPGNKLILTAIRQGGTRIEMVPVSLRVFDTYDGSPRRVEATGPRVTGGIVGSTWSTATVTDIPEWVLAVLDGIR